MDDLYDEVFVGNTKQIYQHLPVAFIKQLQKPLDNSQET